MLGVAVIEEMNSIQPAWLQKAQEFVRLLYIEVVILPWKNF